MTKIVNAVKIPGQSGAYWIKTVAQVVAVAAGFFGIEITLEEGMAAAAAAEGVYLFVRKFFPKKEAV